MALVPHLAFPLRLDPSGQLGVNEQDSLADVRACVHLLLRTPPGARPLAPEIGLEDPTFTAGADAEEIAGYLARYEDRAATGVQITGPDASGRQSVVIDVRLDDERDPRDEPELLP